MTVLDRDIRAALHEEFKRTYPPETVIIDEFSFGGVISDLAVFFPNEIQFWEIKSDSDSLRRLPMQADIYSLFGNSCTLVTGPKHFAKAVKMVPEWWGVQVVQPVGPVLVFERLREPQPNPEQSLRHAVQLFWKREVWAIWSELGETRGKSKMTTWQLASALLARMEPDEVLARVCKAVRTRKWVDHRRPPQVIAA